MNIVHSIRVAKSRHISAENNPNPRTSGAYTHGYAAYFAGCPLAGNPYGIPHPSAKSRQRAQHWLYGWRDAYSDVAAFAEREARHG